MKKIIPFLQLAIISLVVSTLAHAVYLLNLFQNRFMAGMDDGLAQILPFKKHLYDLYTSGEFFYSTMFGLGSGTFGELSYYFSTSVVFFLTVVFFYLLETIHVISHPDLLFWAHAAVFINIFRLAAVLIISHVVFRYMNFKRAAAFLGAAVYGLSAMYFRHAVYWEFFADAYLWLPLLILGIEKIFREQKPAWFIIAVAVSMFDNFYFAYVNFLLAGLYLLVRFFMPLEEDEIPKKQVLVSLLVSGLIGACISTVSFVPAIYAYIANHRPPYTQPIDWFSLSDNILLTSRFVVLPAVIVLMIFAFPLYRGRRFRFFAILAGIAVLLHYSPMAASMFNGFSAPRQRWEYFLSFAAGGLAASGLSQLNRLKSPQLLIATAITAVVYTVAITTDSNLDGMRPVAFAAAGTALVITFLLLMLAARGTAGKRIVASGLIILLIVFTNGYQQGMLAISGDLKNVTEEFITGPRYNDPEIRRLLKQIEKREGDSFYRVDWMEGVRNNIPLVQNFRGVSAYSSILNGELLHFYLYELKIDMGRESISRYATLGRRANLHSLIKADYVILDEDNQNVPYGFKQILSSEHFTVYQNQHELPFVRGAADVYSEKQLQDEPVLRRERAMLSGVVLKNPGSTATLPTAPEEVAFTIEEKAASYQDGKLTVTGETGGVELVLNEPVATESDLYVSFHLENPVPGDGFPLTVNSYRTTRKPNKSLYRTYVDDLTIRVPADEKVQIRMPKGMYQLSKLTVFEAPYRLLRQEVTEESATNQVDWDGSRLQAEYENDSGADYLTMPVPYEKGWRAEVNGKEAEVREANYAFIAVPAEDGLNRIELTYRPPYFFPSLSLSIFSLLFAVVYIRRKKENQSNKKTPGRN